MHDLSRAEKSIILSNKLKPDFDISKFNIQVNTDDIPLNTVLDSIILDALKSIPSNNTKAKLSLCGYVSVWMIKSSQEALNLCDSLDPSLASRYIDIEQLRDVSVRLRSRKLYSTWPKFSGDSFYPVPSPLCGVSASVIYWGDAHKWEAEYGKFRKELLEHSIKLLESTLFINYTK